MAWYWILIIVFLGFNFIVLIGMLISVFVVDRKAHQENQDKVDESLKQAGRHN